MLNKFINKIGVDKILHFCVGAVISFCFSNVVMLQEGTIGINNIWISVIGIIVTMILECIKEFIIDDNPDKKDILATFLGSLIPFVVNAIGILFYIASN